MTIKQKFLEIFSLCALELFFTFCCFFFFFVLFLHFVSFTLHLMFFASFVFCRHLSGKRKNEHFSFFFGAGSGRGGSFNLRPLCSANFVFGCALKIIWAVNSLHPSFPFPLPLLWLLPLLWCFIYFIFFSIFTWGEWGVEMRVPQLL